MKTRYADREKEKGIEYVGEIKNTWEGNLVKKNICSMRIKKKSFTLTIIIVNKSVYWAKD